MEKLIKPLLITCGLMLVILASMLFGYARGLYVCRYNGITIQKSSDSEWEISDKNYPDTHHYPAPHYLRPKGSTNNHKPNFYKAGTNLFIGIQKRKKHFSKVWEKVQD